MIPTGEDWRIKKALKYMAPEKVLQWARTTISPNVNERDIARLQRDLSKPRPRSEDKITKQAPDRQLRDPGTLAAKIDAFIAARSKEWGMLPESYRRFLGWR